MNLAGIVKDDYVNGTGIRLSVFVSGCLNHCPGCFQKETWDFNFGIPFTEEKMNEIIEELKKPRYNGLTILGGDPFELTNQIGVYKLIEKVPENKDIWMFTGYLYDVDLAVGGKRYLPELTDKILRSIDVLVDGPFIEAEKDLTIPFRGSRNQRVIDVKESIKNKNVSLLKINEPTIE